MNPESIYLTIGSHIRKNVKDKTEELEITLLDLTAKSDSDSVVVITTNNYDLVRRDAQAHEIDKASSELSTSFINSWVKLKK